MTQYFKLFARRLSLAAVLFIAVAAVAVPALAQTDLGPAAGAETKTVSLALKVRDPEGIEAFIDSTVTPGNPQFRQFLTVEQFADRFAPSAREVAEVVRQMQSAGIRVTETAPNRLVLKATGTVAALNRYFSVSIHQFEKHGRRYHAPVSLPQMPVGIARIALAVAGLSNEAVFVSHFRPLASVEPSAAVSLSSPARGTATGELGSLTVGDVARLYQVNPLYRSGISGRGRTVGIATLATFDETDAYGYWSAIGLAVKPNRITRVPVDGGADADGASETTLDVQQAGGLAPRADIVVYEAPDTNQGFLDLFVKAVTDNKVDTLSVSWGTPEITVDPSLVRGLDQIFMEAAAQGISLFAASGDAGAYDINQIPYPYHYPWTTKTLTVDSPASSPYITAVGGITLAGTQQHPYATVTVPRDRAWGWDYLEDYFDTYYADYGGYVSMAFPLGGGGGVSVIEKVPAYQTRTPGVQRSAANQSVIYYPNYPDLSGALDFIDLPTGFAGRNLPDVALNADPCTGYLVYFGGSMYSGNGGTSFAAPQMSGITALLGEVVHSRLGFLNPTLYRMARHTAHGSPVAPFTPITSGDNLYYRATVRYNPATGLGSINAANLALRILFGENDD